MKPEYKKTLNYLQYTLGYKKRTCNKIIARYGKEIMKIDIPADKSNYLSPIGVHIQSHWQDFMDFYGTIKEVYKDSKVKNLRGRIMQHNLYSHHIELDPMIDGYNGCTDDF
jgi:hypothetical protein